MDVPIIPHFLSNLMDKGTREHQHRVSVYSKGIADVLCPKRATEMVRIALVHDIGKIFIPEKVLLKPCALTKEEMDLVRLHPIFGAELLYTYFAREISEEEILAVYHHHERWDGHGYPKGLGNKNIPLMARIIAVADAFDAMTSFRSYKVSLKIEEAITELEQFSEIQFDPEVVEAFSYVMRRKGNIILGFSVTVQKDGVVRTMVDPFEQIKTLAAEGRVKEIIALMTNTKESAVREEAYVQTVRLGGPEAVEGFIALLSSPEAHFRNLAVEGLQELGADCTDRLEDLLYESDSDLKILGFNVLAGVRSQAAAAPARRFLEKFVAGKVDVEENVVAAAVECLGGLGDAGDITLLDRVDGVLTARSSHEYVRYVVAVMRESLCSA